MSEFQVGQVVLVRHGNSPDPVLAILLKQRSNRAWLGRKKVENDLRLHGAWTKASVISNEDILSVADNQNENPFGAKSSLAPFFYNHRTNLVVWVERSKIDQSQVSMHFLHGDCLIQVEFFNASDLHDLREACNTTTVAHLCFNSNEASTWTLRSGLARIILVNSRRQLQITDGAISFSMIFKESELKQFQDCLAIWQAAI